MYLKNRFQGRGKMAYKKDYEGIKDHVEYLKDRYGFKGPLHFTDFTNLESIFNSGFLAGREYCETNKINFLDAADREVIERTSLNVLKCTRFYYKEKTPTLYRNEGIKVSNSRPHVPIPVYLLFDEELLYLDNTVFTDCNAGSTYCNFRKSGDFFENMGWDVIFHRGPMYEGDDRMYITRKRNAELLSLNPVPINYLRKIIFRCEADRKRAVNLFGDSELYKVDKTIFNNHNNYIDDYSIELKEDSIKIILRFNRLIANYNLKVDILNDKNKVINYDIREKELVSKDIFNREIEDFKMASSVEIEYKEKLEQFYSLKVYLNDNLCIEDYFGKYIIEYFNIKHENGNMVINTSFINEKITLSKHSYEILDNNNKVISSNNIKFNPEQRGTHWTITFEKFNSSCKKIRYYINNILCIDKTIKIEDNLPF